MMELPKKRAAEEASGTPAKRARRAAADPLASLLPDDLLANGPKGQGRQKATNKTFSFAIPPVLDTSTADANTVLVRGRRRASNTPAIAPVAPVAPVSPPVRRGRGCRKATNKASAPTIAPVPAIADRKIATPKGRDRRKAINKAPPPPPVVIAVSSASSLSSLGSRTPSPPPEVIKSSPAPSIKRDAPVQEEEEAPSAKRTRRAAVVSKSVSPPASSKTASPPAAKRTTPWRKATKATVPETGYLACDWTGCDRVFTRVEHLDRHVKCVHEKVKEHVCEGCHQGFSRKDNMKQHQRKCERFLALDEEEEEEEEEL
jgi:hypothetical protein